MKFDCALMENDVEQELSQFISTLFFARREAAEHFSLFVQFLPTFALRFELVTSHHDAT